MRDQNPDESSRPRILVMTATIQPEPNVSSRLAVLDPDERRRQYAQALSSYAGAVDELDGIVLVENSGADLSDFVGLAPPGLPLELVSVPAAPSRPGSRRGYLEMAMVADAYATSRLLRQPGAVGIKVTGRYRLQNLARLLRSWDQTQDIGFNLRRYPRSWADMWVFYATQCGIDALRPHLHDVDVVEPGGSAELSMFRIVNRLHADGVRVQRRFDVEPRLAGTRGVDAARYESPRQRIKWAVRNAARAVVPQLWI